MPDHIGTHKDAPIQCWEPGVSLEAVDIRRLIGEAVCRDMYKGDVDYGYTVTDFELARPETEPGDIVLIYSGYRDATETERIRQIYITPDAAHWLVDRGIHAFGCEPAGIEPVPDGLFTYHWYERTRCTCPPGPLIRSFSAMTSTSLKDLQISTKLRASGCVLPVFRSRFLKRAAARSEHS